MPTSKENLVSMLKDLGLRSSDDVFVHSSLKSLGYVINGPYDVIDSLIEVINIDKGTILMPAHSGQLTDPVDWKNPPLSVNDVEEVRDKMNLFDKKLTPTRGRGIVAQSFLSYTGVKRSEHPLNSVSAIGKNAEWYTSEHSFHEPEGIESPIGKLFSKNGKVIGLGVGVTRFTAIHLAEYIADVEYLKYDNPSVLIKNENDKNIFKEIKRYPGSSEKFTNILPILRNENLITELKFNGNIMTCLMIKPVVERIVEILSEDPDFLIT